MPAKTKKSIPQARKKQQKRARAVKPSANPVAESKAAKIPKKQAAKKPAKATKQPPAGNDTDRLTPKQETFALAVARGLTQSDAYREAFKPRKSTDKTIQEEASRLMATPKITARVDEIRTLITAKTAQEVSYDYADAMGEIDAAIRLATLFGQAGAVMTGLALKTKLAGLQVEDRKNERSPVSGLTHDQARSALETLQAIKKARAQA